MREYANDARDMIGASDRRMRAPQSRLNRDLALVGQLRPLRRSLARFFVAGKRPMISAIWRLRLWRQRSLRVRYLDAASLASAAARLAASAKRQQVREKAKARPAQSSAAREPPRRFACEGGRRARGRAHTHTGGLDCKTNKRTNIPVRRRHLDRKPLGRQRSLCLRARLFVCLPTSRLFFFFFSFVRPR